MKLEPAKEYKLWDSDSGEVIVSIEESLEPGSNYFINIPGSLPVTKEQLQFIANYMLEVINEK